MLAAALVVLAATVGPGFDIGLTRNGHPVHTLRPGRYAITVRDRSPIHDFHLKGPGVSRVLTGVEFEGTKRVVVRLRPGRYVYVCDPHAAFMRGSFTVR
jgi:plastocyanin